jgi:hypothetical protein
MVAGFLARRSEKGAERRGMKPYEAALKGSSEIGFTIISISVSLIAVFIPLFFMSAGLCWGQTLQAPARVTLRMGVGYDQGDFGARE